MVFCDLKRPTELGTPPGGQRRSTRPHDHTRRVLDAESCRAWEAGKALEQLWRTAWTLFGGMKRPTQLGSSPGCQRHSTQPHENGRVLDAESYRESLESCKGVRTAVENGLAAVDGRTKPDHRYRANIERREDRRGTYP